MTSSKDHPVAMLLEAEDIDQYCADRLGRKSPEELLQTAQELFQNNSQGVFKKVPEDDKKKLEELLQDADKNWSDFKGHKGKPLSKEQAEQLWAGGAARWHAEQAQKLFQDHITDRYYNTDKASKDTINYHLNKAGKNWSDFKDSEGKPLSKERAEQLRNVANAEENLIADFKSATDGSGTKIDIDKFNENLNITGMKIKDLDPTHQIPESTLNYMIRNPSDVSEGLFGCQDPQDFNPDALMNIRPICPLFGKDKDDTKSVSSEKFA